MKDARQLDVLMSRVVLGHQFYFEKNGALKEKLPGGQSRPLRSYSLDISAAWEVVQKLGITLIPIDAGWFAMAGNKRSWSSPAEFLTYLQNADFANSGAAIGEQAPMTICLAAMKTLDSRQLSEVLPDSEEPPTTSQPPVIN